MSRTTGRLDNISVPDCGPEKSDEFRIAERFKFVYLKMTRRALTVNENLSRISLKKPVRPHRLLVRKLLCAYEHSQHLVTLQNVFRCTHGSQPRSAHG